MKAQRFGNLGGKACDSVVWKESQEQKTKRALPIGLYVYIKIFTFEDNDKSNISYGSIWLSRKKEDVEKIWLAGHLTRFLKVVMCVSTFQSLTFDFTVCETDFHQHKNYGLFLSLTELPRNFHQLYKFSSDQNSYVSYMEPLLPFLYPTLNLGEKIT